MKKSDIKVGQSVCFKSDFEQVGRVTGLERMFGADYVRLEALGPEGFSGDYIGGDMMYTEHVDRVWVE